MGATAAQSISTKEENDPSPNDKPRNCLFEKPDASVRDILQIAIKGAKETDDFGADQVNLKRILARRNEKAQLYFNQIAGRFDRSYGPGRSWQAFGHLLLRILPPLTIADLGSGEGLLSELLARRAKKVIAVDNSATSIPVPVSVDGGAGTDTVQGPTADTTWTVTGDGSGDFVLSSWATLLDAGRMQDGEPFLAVTAPLAVARLSEASAARLGLGR